MLAARGHNRNRPKGDNARFDEGREARHEGFRDSGGLK